MSHIQVSPYGSWVSPISAELVATAFHSMSQIKAEHGCLYWIEQFPEQKGRNAILCRDAHGDIHELTPRDYSVRNRVHEYGGGDYCVQHGILYFCNDRDQRVYKQENNKQPIPITPKPDQPMGWRYADLSVTEDGEHLVCVRETHALDQPVKNEIVLIATAEPGEVGVLASGADFYAAPVINAAKDALIYLRWNHPQMPWDGTELCRVDLMDGLSPAEVEVLAGGVDESICQPKFSPDGSIYFVSDRTNWWNLYKYSHGTVERVVMMDAEMAYPAWIFGTNFYEFIDQDTIACLVNEKGRYWLGTIAGGEISKISTDYDSFEPAIAYDRGLISCIASNAAMAPAIVQVNVADQQVEMLHSSSTLMIDAAYLCLPEVIEFPTEKGQTAFANYYEACNPHFSANSNELPPLIVISHGGPTSAASTSLNLKIQYWTTRGFSVVDVNYGGSSGYGRAYRDRLKGEWGIVDVADCVNAAKYLVNEGRVDPDRLTIKGSSAGGLTTLCALLFYDIFSAGASYYGVADLEGLVSDTHKFEAHYMDSLVGQYPDEQKTYQDRSPLHHADLLTCPVIFLQGLEDKVVVPAQAEAMMAALDVKQLPYAYITFPHEQHGFRDAKSIKKALESELSFYSQIFKVNTADDLTKVTVKHLSQR